MALSSVSDAQIIVVGSGMNSLVCAALLAQRGKSVLVLERNDRLGGCIRTEELFPGYRHDVLSSWYPLFVGGPAYAALKPALQAAGLEFAQCDYATGLALPDGSGIALKQDIADSARRLDAWAPGDGAAFGAMAQRLFGEDAALTFGLLGQNPYGAGMLKLLFGEWRRRGLDGLMAFAADSLESFRRWSDRELQSDAARADRALGAAHRPGTGRRLFGADRQADLRRGGGRRHAGGQGRQPGRGGRPGQGHRTARRQAADRRRRRTHPDAWRRPPPPRRRRRGRRPRVPRRRGRGLQRHARPAVRHAAARRARAGAAPRRRLPPWPRRHADPFRARRAARLAHARTAPRAAGAPDREHGAGLRLGHRGQQRPVAGAADAGYRPAGRRRSVARAGRRLDPVGADAGAAGGRQGRCRRPDRHARRRPLDRGPARSRRRPRAGAAGAGHARPGATHRRPPQLLAGRPGGAELQPGGRRSVRGRLFARPVLLAAPVRRQPGRARPPHAAAQPFPHRRRHPPGSRAGRRFRLSRRTTSRARGGRSGT